MYKIALVGFGSLGYRYFEAIYRIRLPNIKLHIIDKKINSIIKKHHLITKSIKTSKEINSFPKKVDLCIISTTCQNRHILLKKIINISNFQNLILEKPLTQSPKELLQLDNILRKIPNVWVNTDKRCEDIYKFVKSKIDLKNKISMKVEGNSWGICCNSLHYVDLFNFLSGQSLQIIKGRSSLRWFPSKRNGFQELDDAKLNLKFGKHELHLVSKKNSLPKNLKIFIKNKKNIFYIREKINIFELRHNNKTFFFKNDPLSIKMTKTIKKILLTNKSNLPNYLNSTKLYHPLIQFFLEKWRIKYPKSIKVPIT